MKGFWFLCGYVTLQQDHNRKEEYIYWSVGGADGYLGWVRGLKRG